MSNEINYKGLDSFRALAFFAVFLFHLGMFEAGYLGVNAFFVLSGFLLTPILLNMKEDLSVKSYFINFYGRRALRIFPLYFSFLLVTYGLAVFSLSVLNFDSGMRLERATDQIFYALTYTYNFFSMSSIYEHTHLYTHLWSLAVEEQFYLLWPMVILFTPANKVKVMLLAVVASGLLVRAWLMWFVAGSPEYFNDKPDMVVYSFSFSNFDAFAIGGLFALYVKNVKPLILLALAGFVLAVGFASVYLSTGVIDPLSLGYPSFMPHAYQGIWGFTLLSILFASALVAIKNNALFPWLFNFKPMVYTGKISYGLYLIHYPIIWLVDALLGDISFAVQIVIILVASYALAILSYELMEKRLLAKKDDWFSRTEDKTSQKPAAA